MYCVSKASYQRGQCPQCSPCFTWSTILKSADPLVAFDRVIGEVIGRYVPTTVLRSRSADKQWFDAKQTANRPWCRACNAEHLGSICLTRAEGQSVYGAARESHN